MDDKINSKVVGSAIIGFALVAGAYVISNFNKTDPIIQTASTVQTTTPVQRVSIAVTDNDDNGIEDWRDSFVTSAPIILSDEDTPYTPPDTLTGKMSISLMENVIRARGYGPFGDATNDIVGDTVDILVNETNQKVYTLGDITIMKEWDDQDIVNYANTVASTIDRYNVSGLDWELAILNDILKSSNPARVVELDSLANMYKSYRDDTLLIPVPEFLAKEHLDLINTYEALYADIDAMTLVFDDPVRSLFRLKRYEEDATGLSLALQNMYTGLIPHANLFTVEDPALLLVLFSPDYKKIN